MVPIYKVISIKIEGLQILKSGSRIQRWMRFEHAQFIEADLQVPQRRKGVPNEDSLWNPREGYNHDGKICVHLVPCRSSPVQKQFCHRRARY
jgi:hypothetical protein